MFNYKKRAFTITELVIVIAVVAILAAVLIPTFSNVVKKANQTADIQAVRNANTALANAEVLDGKPASTISDALAVVAQAGYNVESFTPSSNGDILWDQANNRFALVDNEGKVVLQDEGKPIDTSKIVKIGENRTSVDIWMITESVAELESGRYSYYLKSSMSDNIEVTTGVDVGTNDDVNITYATNATQSVDIRTNGGTLTVNAPNSDVHHYGTASEVLITDVKGQSYHEYGKATSITLKSGHVVLERTAEVPTIKVSGGVITNAHNKEFELVADGENIGDVTVDGKEVYKVQFFSEENVKLAEQLVVEGEKARDPELKNFGKAGHTFKGWYKGAIKFDFAKDVVTADTTLIAEWTPNEYTVTFVSEEVEVAPITVTYGEEYTLPKPPARTGYTFAGWYSGEYKYDDGIWASEEDLTLTAKWTINTYTVTFVTEHGTVEPQKVEHGSLATDPELTEDGFDLLGWFKADGTQFDFATPITDNITLTARWEVAKTTVTIKASDYADAIAAGDALRAELEKPAGEGADIVYIEGTFQFTESQITAYVKRVLITRSVEIVGLNNNAVLLHQTTAADSSSSTVDNLGFISVENTSSEPINFKMTGVTLKNGLAPQDQKYYAVGGINFGRKVYASDNPTASIFKGNIEITDCTFDGFTKDTVVVAGQDSETTTLLFSNNNVVATQFSIENWSDSLPNGVDVKNCTATLNQNKFLNNSTSSQILIATAVLIKGDSFVVLTENTFALCQSAVIAYDNSKVEMNKNSLMQCDSSVILGSLKASLTMGTGENENNFGDKDPYYDISEVSTILIVGPEKYDDGWYYNMTKDGYKISILYILNNFTSVHYSDVDENEAIANAVAVAIECDSTEPMPIETIYVVDENGNIKGEITRPDSGWADYQF